MALLFLLTCLLYRALMEWKGPWLRLVCKSRTLRRTPVKELAIAVITQTSHMANQHTTAANLTVMALAILVEANATGTTRTTEIPIMSR